ncbi:MAG: hypothetical protein FJ279_03545 [Planctomycetes bacterium]|nr:hypothetical protein [Planctomycetota bacterium]MBM4078112.1 hypothetical protein [Planctomycetota bacterium]MBM4085578.1 hypothetical protein [Planctomycetota bacterium]
MKLPANAVIAREKVTRYLLVPQPRGDKSAFLALAGYTLDDPDQLLTDLRQQILPLDARPVERNKFGQLYEIAGPLRGPNGVTVRVRTIWMTEHLTGGTKFITLVPGKRSE